MDVGGFMPGFLCSLAVVGRPCSNFLASTPRAPSLEIMPVLLEKEYANRTYSRLFEAPA